MPPVEEWFSIFKRWGFLAKEDTLVPIVGDLPLTEGDDEGAVLFPNEKKKEGQFKLLFSVFQRLRPFMNFTPIWSFVLTCLT